MESARRSFTCSNSPLRSAWLVALSIAITACGGGGGSESPVASTSPPTSTPSSPPIAAPVMITGSDSALVSAVMSTQSDKPVAPKEVSNGVLLSRVLVSLKADATVGQLNAAGRTVGAKRITSSESGSLLVVLEVPVQANIAAIQSLAKTLRAQPGIAFAWPGQTAKSSILPEFSPGIPVSKVGLSHLLSNRFPQAWNARHAIPADCLPHSIDVYALDKFGPSSTRPNFFSQLDHSSFFDDTNGMSNNATSPEAGHGYDVVSALAAKFDSNTPTGANPFKDCVIVHAVEALDVEYVDALRHAAHAIAADTARRVVMTSSIGFTNGGFCGVNGDQPCDAVNVPTTVPEFVFLALEDRALVAAEWARLVRTLQIKDKVLITQSAGNVDELPAGFLAQNYLGFRSVEFSSPEALATHLHELKALLTSPALWKSPAPLPNFTISAADADFVIEANPSLDPASGLANSNLLIVDSGAGGETPADVTQSSFDYLGANVRAVGEAIVLDGKNERGTSFAAPLVAGLAAYLWNLSPALAAQNSSTTVDLLKRSSATTSNSPTVPIVDAYAAVLQLDDVPGCCGGPISAPIRFGLMDVNGDGVFDALDLQKFADAYGLANPNTPTIPSARDFSRFDLNGDGYTGGIPIAAFDLDVNGLDANGRSRINATDEQIEGYPITFNEAALSDLQILCYYAYSPLYHLDSNGQNDQVRTSLLGPDHCVGARITAQLPTQISSSAVLNTVVELPTGNNTFAAAANMQVDLTPTCATVSPSSGRTNASGAISATVAPANGCTSVSIQITARANPGTTPLAQQVVAATVAASPASLHFLQQTLFFHAVPACSRVGIAVDSTNVTVSANPGSILNQSAVNGRTLFEYHSLNAAGSAVLSASSTLDPNVKGSFTTTVDPLLNLFGPTSSDSSTLSIQRQDDFAVGGASDKYVLHYTNNSTVPQTNSFFVLTPFGESFSGTDGSGNTIAVTISKAEDDPNFGSPGYEANGTVTFANSNPQAKLRYVRFCQ